jgi:orotate phosphoribosyltransferase
VPDVLHDDGLHAAPAGGTQVPGAARALQSEDDAYLDGLIRSGAVRVSSAENGWFMLRNGTRSPVYIDHGEILCDPQHNHAFVTALRRHIARNFDPADTVLMNVDSKSSPHVAGALATLLGLRQIIFVPDQVRQAEAGTDRQFRLPDMTGVRRVVVVDDVLTPDDTTVISVVAGLRALLAAEKRTSDVDLEYHLVVGVLRATSAIASLATRGIKASGLVTLSEVLARVDDPSLDWWRRHTGTEADPRVPSTPP